MKNVRVARQEEVYMGLTESAYGFYKDDMFDPEVQTEFEHSNVPFSCYGGVATTSVSENIMVTVGELELFRVLIIKGIKYVKLYANEDYIELIPLFDTGTLAWKEVGGVNYLFSAHTKTIESTFWKRKISKGSNTPYFVPVTNKEELLKIYSRARRYGDVNLIPSCYYIHTNGSMYNLKDKCRNDSVLRMLILNDNYDVN